MLSILITTLERLASMTKVSDPGGTGSVGLLDLRASIASSKKVLWTYGLAGAFRD